jgi:hypothetical protein
MENNMDKYTENRKAVEKMAVDVITMEDSHDSSMRGVFLDTLVSEYVKNYGERFALMFNTIYDQQSEVCDDYGDIDVKVTKLEIIGDIIDRKNYTNGMLEFDKKYDYSAKAFLLTDCCGCNGSFIIAKIVKQSKLTDSINTYYFVCETDNDDLEKVDLSKLSRYAETCIVEWKFNQPYDGWELTNHKRMLYFYNKFKGLIDTIMTPYWQLTQENK